MEMGVMNRDVVRRYYVMCLCNSNKMNCSMQLTALTAVSYAVTGAV